MNRSLIYLLLILSFSAYGQEKKDTLVSNKNRKFSIGINISPDYCYRTLTKKDKSLSDSVWNFAKHIEDSIYAAKFGYTAGVNLAYEFNKHWAAEVGIQYSNKGYKTIPIKTGLIDLYGNITYTKATNIANYIYLDIPLKAIYTFFDKRLQLVIGIGATFNYLLKAIDKSIPEDASLLVTNTVSNYPYNKINFSPTISAGVKYKINDRMNLRIEPTYRYGILSIDDKSYKSIHLWSYGLNIGYYYKL